VAETGNIADMLQSLLSALNSGGTDSGAEAGGASGEPAGDSAANPGAAAGFDFGSFFENIDFDMIMKIGELFSRFSQPDKNTDLLRALKPHLREENKEKIDTAIKLLKITALLPLLREGGFMDKLF